MKPFNASNFTVEEALQSNSSKQNNQSDIPFVCSYSPSLPDVGKIIKRYWGLFKISASESVRRLFDSKPIVACNRPTHSSLKNEKCNRRRCTHCSTIKESDCFMSTNTASVHKMNYDLSCTSAAVIYTQTKKKRLVFMILYFQIKLRCRHKNNTKMFPKRQAYKYCLFFVLAAYSGGLLSRMLKTAFSSIRSN